MASEVNKRAGHHLISSPANVILNVIFCGCTIAFIIPFLLVISASLTDEQILTLHGIHIIPEKLSLEAYQYLFMDSTAVVRAYGITILVTIIGTMLGVLLNALYAYPLSRPDFPYRNSLALLIFFTMLFSGGLVPTYIVNVQLLELSDTIWALIIPGLVSPFFVILFRTFFRNSIPIALIESVRLDGAGELRTFFQIVMPLSLPVFATTGLMASLGIWNDWFSSLLYINDEKLVSLQFLMYKAMKNLEVLMNASSQGFAGAGNELNKLPAEGIRMAMAIVGVGPIMLAYPFFQRYFIKGLTVGAVKG